jgi:arabinofuranosyltransferase
MGHPGDKSAGQRAHELAFSGAPLRDSSWPRHVIGLALALLALHGLLYLSALAWDVVDDAYISFRYARNLMEGHGLVFNIGEKVEGYTNFLWTVLLAPLIGLGIPPTPVAAAGGLAFSGLTLWLVYWLGKRMAGVWVGAIAALFLSLDGSFALWSVGGMETPMFTCLALIGAVAYFREQSAPRRWPLSGILFALTAMTRPEGVMLFAMTAGHQILVNLWDRRRLFLRRDLVRILLFGVLWGAYFLGRWRYYGFPLPNTFYAKVDPTGTQAQIMRGIRYVLTFARIHLGYIAWLPLGLLLLFRRVDRRMTYAVGVVGMYVAYVVFVGGDWSVGRFLVPPLPFLYLLLAEGLVEGYRWLQTRRPGLSVPLHYLSLAVLILSLAGMGLASSLWGEYALFVRSFEAGLANRARIAMGHWLRDNLPSDTVIAVDAAGELPYYSRLRTLDLFGITQPAIAHMETPQMGQGTPGHEKFGLGFVLAQLPDYIIIYGNALDGVEPYQRVDVDWTEDPQLRAFLSVYKLEAHSP